MSNTEIVCRITNQAGADVHVLKAPGRDTYDPYDHGWKCTGCDQGDDPTEPGDRSQAHEARRRAASHADTCRFQSA